MTVKLLRWIIGWTDFEINAKYPEKFLNTAVKSGINIWNPKKENNILCASARSSDMKYIMQTADKTMCDIHIIKNHGLIYILKKYKHRCGILIGLLIWGLAIKFLTGFIWNIKIELPPMINEYEIRQESREHGFFEGAKTDSFDPEIVEAQVSLKDSRISWITINIIGTDAEVKISPNLALDVENKTKVTASNIISSADGTITRMEVKKGYSTVKVGEGIHKGQLLVSGVKEYTDGSTKLFDSEAKIYAKTLRTVTLKIPESYQILQPQNEYTNKLDIDIMGLTLPLTFNGNPNGDYIKFSEKQQLDILSKGVPIYFLSETWQKYKKTPVHLNDKQAEKILQNKLKFYELFMLYSADSATVLNKKLSLSQDKNYYILTAEYTIEENIAQKNIIQIKDTSNSGT